MGSSPPVLRTTNDETYRSKVRPGIILSGKTNLGGPGANVGNDRINAVASGKDRHGFCISSDARWIVSVQGSVCRVDRHHAGGGASIFSRGSRREVFGEEGLQPAGAVTVRLRIPIRSYDARTWGSVQARSMRRAVHLDFSDYHSNLQPRTSWIVVLLWDSVVVSSTVFEHLTSPS